MTPVSENLVSPAPVLNLQDIARNAGDLPALPGTAMDAMKLTQDPDVSARELQAVIAKDQALTARILKIVNSAMYCFEREVSTLSHAIAILGMDVVRSIIVAASVQQVFHSSASGGRDLTTKLFWEHSWGTATAAKAIAGRIGYGVAEEAFTCGLLHDMGKMVMMRNQNRIYTEILKKVYCGESSFCQAEVRAFGFSHAHVGALLALKWRFPPQLVEGILYHHDFTAAPEYRQLAAIAALADSMMIFLEVGFQKDKSLKLEDEASAKHLKLTAPLLNKMAAEVQAMIPILPGRVNL
jgi:putative nucleotidyltransferase with HDIG domain